MELVIIVLVIISFLVNSLYSISTVFYSKRTYKENSVKQFPYISILKPVKNIDDEMEVNIESIFKLDYPKFEILFAVDSRKDPVTKLIKNVMSRFPKIKSRIIETGHRGDQNPKIHKLSFMESFARGDLFWVSDSNIRVGTTTLKSLIEPYVNNGIHLIFSPIKGEGSRTFGSLMENSYLNHYLSGNVLSAWNFFKQEIVVGKSMLIEKEALMSFGGFSYFKDFIAEDQIMGETFRKSGYKIATNNTWVTNFNQTSSINSFYNRMSRWAKLRFSMHRGIYFAEIVTNTTAMIMLAIGILRDKFVIFILPLLLFRILLEMITYYVIDETEQYKKTNMLLLPFAIIFKELLLIFVWFTPFFSNHIRWRGGKIAIAKRSVISNSLYAIFVESF